MAPRTALAAVAAAKVNLRAVNHRALARYQQFWQSLVMLDVTLGEIEKLIATAWDDDKAKCSARVPDVEELTLAVKRVSRSFQVMHTATKRWEAELISREWR
jgi:hypothetical protein